MIVLYKGRIGSGKTLTMVKDAYKYYLNGYSIYSNFSLIFGNSISSDEVLSLNRDSNLRDCVLVLDEVQLFFDSRNFKKDENKNFSYFIQQLRKRNIIILCTAQYSNTIDIRLRQHIQILVCPSFDSSSFMCRALYFDLTLLEDVLVSPSSLVPSSIVFYSPPLFPLYNTYEMLK